MPNDLQQPGRPATITVTVGSTLAEADRRLIFATLEHCGGVKKWAARLLGISLKTLYNRLARYRAEGTIPPTASVREHTNGPTAGI